MEVGFIARAFWGELWDGERSPGSWLKDSVRCQGTRGWSLRKRPKDLIYSIPNSINLERQYRQSPQLPYQRDPLAHDKMFSVTSVTCKLPCWPSCLPTFTSGIWVSQRIVEGKSWFSLLSHITHLRSLIINVRCLWVYRSWFATKNKMNTSEGFSNVYFFSAASN